MKKFVVPLVVSCGLAFIASPVFASELIFDADFDSQADWAPEYDSQSYRYDGDTAKSGAGENLPGKFDYYYTNEQWHPKGVEYGGNEYPRKEPIGQISGKFSRNEGGKSFIVYDESWGGPSQWGADAVLTKDLGREYPELWLEAWVKFDPSWVWADQIEGSGQSAMKLLRCRRHSGITTDNRFSFFGADSRSGSPVAIFDLKSWTTSTGNYVRPLAAIRGYTHPDTYKTDDDYYGFAGDYPTKIESSVKLNQAKSLSWQEVFLDDKWHKIGFYIKMDSHPGAKDGIVQLWIDDHEIFSKKDVPWRRSGDPDTMGWNECSLGGNANNIPYPEEAHYDQWYAVDDFKIYSGRPNKPRPPTDVTISID